MATKKQIEALINESIQTRNARLALEGEAAKLKVREDSIADELKAANVTDGVYGKFSLKATTKKVPRCTDWAGFHAYIKETGNFDMLHKRLTETAVMARVDNGEYVPGITTDDKVSYKFSIA